MLKRLFATAALATCLLNSTPAHSQEVTASIRVETGLVVPTAEPQAQTFNPGLAVDLKPGLNLGSFFTLGPSFQIITESSKVAGINADTLWSYGGFLMLHRPYTADLSSEWWGHVFPFFDADIKYVKTTDAPRLGLALAVGARTPTSPSRSCFIGPFVRYDVVNAGSSLSDFNARSNGNIIFGLSLELMPPTRTE